MSDLVPIPVPEQGMPFVDDRESPRCDLCGLPVPSGKARGDSGKKGLRFCCPGCRQVYAVLSAATGSLPADFQKTDLYRACLQAGIIPSGTNGNPEENEAPLQDDPIPALELTLRVNNMWCPACAWLIEEVLRRKKGIIRPRVTFLADTARLGYLPHVITPAEIRSTVAKLGYSVSSPEDEPEQQRQQRDLHLRLGISAIFAMNGMMLSWAVYSGLFRDLGPTIVAYLSYPLLLMTLPVIFYGGMPILRSAWTGFRFKRISMDTLIAISTLSAFFYSLAEMLRGSVHLYFDTAAMLVTIVLLGRFIEMKARHRVLAGMGLDELGTQKARLLQDGRERWVKAEAARAGDVVLVQKGERIPLDGLILKGKALLDQSVLTGEPKPVSRAWPEEVLAGSMLLAGEIEVSVSRVAKESYLRRMTDLMLDGLESKQVGEDAADSFSRALVPGLMAATALTACVLYLFGLPAWEIFFRCLTMLLISCPCAVGIAVPLVRMAVTGLARKKGIIVRNSRALDQLPSIDTIVLDKTGTITEGRFAYDHMVSAESDENEALPLLAAIEEASPHLLAREILRRSKALDLAVPKASSMQEHAGRGITGDVGGRKVFVGNRRLVADLAAPLPVSLDESARSREQAGMTTVFFGWNGAVKGFLVFGDQIRTEAAELVRWLRNRGITPVLLSGDGKGTTEAVARSLSIENFSGEMLPSDKAERVGSLLKDGRKVAVVGDGVNDAAALARANVGIAFGTGYSLMERAADLVLVSGRVATIKDAFAIASLSVRSIRQNLAFAFIYNMVAIPVAATGLLNPLVAVLAMFASSLTVIVNALRITRT